MSAYLVEVDDTEHGVCYPRIIGPFDSEQAAEDFAYAMHLGTTAQNGQGGYSAVHVVCEATATSPDAFIDSRT